LFIFSKPIISIFLGEKFLETIKLLRILSPILFFKSLSFGFVLVIILSDMQKKRILPQFIVAVVNILFNILLIPYFGITAVSWVYLISEILLTLGYGLIVVKLSKKIVDLSVNS
jgi:O-antigen/teichoic acid export membrane protein